MACAWAWLGLAVALGLALAALVLTATGWTEGPGWARFVGTVLIAGYGAGLALMVAAQGDAYARRAFDHWSPVPVGRTGPHQLWERVLIRTHHRPALRHALVAWMVADVAALPVRTHLEQISRLAAALEARWRPRIILALQGLAFVVLAPWAYLLASAISPGARRDWRRTLWPASSAAASWGTPRQDPPAATGPVRAPRARAT